MKLKSFAFRLGLSFIISFCVIAHGADQAPRMTCGEFLSLLVKSNPFVASSTVIPVLPVQDILATIGTKFVDQILLHDLLEAALNSKSGAVRLLIQVAGLQREKNDGQRFIDEILNYGVTPSGINLESTSSEYFLFVSGPARLVLDVLGHPAVSVVIRATKE